MDDYRDFFPNLGDQNHKKTSEWDQTYNCIAWAAGDSDHWWDVETGYYWPDGANVGSVPLQTSLRPLRHLVTYGAATGSLRLVSRK